MSKETATSNATIDTIIIVTVRMKELAQFYQDGLQLNPPQSQGDDHLGFPIAGTYLGFDMVKDAEFTYPGAVSLWFRVNDIEVTFKDEMDIRDISLYFDNESVLPKCGFDGKVLRCGCDVEDGEHIARLNIARSGWPNTRTTTWKFTVDATPPPLDASLVEEKTDSEEGKENPGKYTVKTKVVQVESTPDNAQEISWDLRGVVDNRTLEKSEYNVNVDVDWETPGFDVPLVILAVLVSLVLARRSVGRH